MNAKAAAHKQNSVGQASCLSPYSPRTRLPTGAAARPQIPSHAHGAGRKSTHPAQKTPLHHNDLCFLPSYSSLFHHPLGDLCKSGKLRNAEHRSAISTEIRAEQCSALRPPPQEKNLCDTRPTPPKGQNAIVQPATRSQLINSQLPNSQTAQLFARELRLTEPACITYFPRLAGRRNQRLAPTFFSD